MGAHDHWNAHRVTKNSASHAYRTVPQLLGHGDLDEAVPQLIVLCRRHCEMKVDFSKAYLLPSHRR